MVLELPAGVTDVMEVVKKVVKIVVESCKNKNKKSHYYGTCRMCIMACHVFQGQ